MIVILPLVVSFSSLRAERKNALLPVTASTSFNIPKWPDGTNTYLSSVGVESTIATGNNGFVVAVSKIDGSFNLGKLSKGLPSVGETEWLFVRLVLTSR